MGEDGMILMEAVSPPSYGSSTLISVKNESSAEMFVLLSTRGLCVQSLTIPVGSKFEFNPHGNIFEMIYFNEVFLERRKKILQPGDHIILNS